MKLQFWKREKMENSIELETVVVTLPKTKREMTITQLVNEMDEVKENEDKPYMCNGEERVKVGEEEMSVNELIEKHMSMKSSADAAGKEQKENESDEEAKKKALELAAHEQKEMDEKKKNEETEEEKKQNAFFDTLKNAHIAPIKEQKSIDLSEDRVARGKSRYGSN
jgi:hypothetical protein